VVLCAAKIGGGRRLVAQSVRLGNGRMARPYWRGRDL